MCVYLLALAESQIFSDDVCTTSSRGRRRFTLQLEVLWQEAVAKMQDKRRGAKALSHGEGVKILAIV